MGNGIPMHTESDADMSFIGDAHMEGDKLVVGDAHVAEAFARALGVFSGGRQMVFLRIYAHKITTNNIVSSQTMDGAFSEPSEPKV